MRVVVTGGLGALGSQVVGALVKSGHDPVVASRRTGVDLETGAGVHRVLADADAVIHTADSTDLRKHGSVTVGAGRTLIEHLARIPSPPHLVTISIVGCEQVDYAYYRAKRSADELVLSSGLPATVVRATQFHSLAAFFARVGRVGPLERRRPPHLVTLPPLGAAMRDFGAGRILPGPEAEVGGERFEQWLERQPTPLRGR